MRGWLLLVAAPLAAASCAQLRVVAENPELYDCNSAPGCCSIKCKEGESCIESAGACPERSPEPNSACDSALVGKQCKYGLTCPPQEGDAAPEDAEPRRRKLVIDPNSDGCTWASDQMCEGPSGGATWTTIVHITATDPSSTQAPGVGSDDDKPDDGTDGSSVTGVPGANPVACKECSGRRLFGVRPTLGGASEDGRPCCR